MNSFQLNMIINQLVCQTEFSGIHLRHINITMDSVSVYQSNHKFPLQLFGSLKLGI